MNTLFSTQAEIPMDPGALFRVRKQHARVYRRWAAARVADGDAPDGRDLVDVAHASLYVRASRRGVRGEGKGQGPCPST